MAKKDPASKRLAEEIAFAKLLKKTPPLFTPEDLGGMPATEQLPTLLWLNEDPGPVWLGLAQGLGEGDHWDKPILDAFKAFGLDHRNDGDWCRLVFYLARVLFPKRRPSGPQKKWTDKRHFQLLADVAAYKRKHPKASDAEICGWLHRKSYPETSDGLRRALQDARNPKRNSELAQMADLVERTATGNWTRAHDEAAIAKRVGWVIENADALWKLRK
jgi:hypothetical protein